MDAQLVCESGVNVLIAKISADRRPREIKLEGALFSSWFIKAQSAI
jgi:hypothetical protein